MFPPPLGERQHIKIPRLLIPKEVCEQVSATIWRLAKVCTPPYPYSDFWIWKDGDSNCYGRGSWVKRLRKWYKQRTGRKLPDDVAGLIGDIVGNAMKGDEEYWYDVTDVFDWEAGDFGDKDSCFWGSNSKAKDIIASNGGLAIRCFESEAGRGIGRAWMAPIDSDMFVLFNGYGKSAREFALLVSAAMEFDSTYRKIELKNCGTSTSILYINNETGYLVGPSAAVAEHDDCYDLQYSIRGKNGELIEFCVDCGVEVNEYSHRVNGEVWCENCFYDNFTVCEHCQEAVPLNDVYHVEGGRYCENCASDARCCRRCGEYFWARNMLSANDEWYCDWCYGTLFIRCVKCKESVKRDYAIVVEWEPYCEDCAADSCPCEYCGENFWEEDTVVAEDGRYCQECYDKLFTKCVECGEVVERSTSRMLDGTVYRCLECRQRES